MGRRRRNRGSSGSGSTGSGGGSSRSKSSKIVQDLFVMMYSSKGVAHNKSVVLDQIHDYYKEALDRLPSTLIPPLLEAGFCFGFFDPVSNIIANTVSYDSLSADQQEEGEGGEGQNKKRKRKKSKTKAKGKNVVRDVQLRKKAISEIVREDSMDVQLAPDSRDWDDSTVRDSSIAARSLRGLVAFLTCYFRYIQNWEALHYLRISKADLLVAVRLIELDRDMNTFTIHNPTAKIALTCAAITAMHSKVCEFVSSSFSLSSRANKVLSLLTAPHCLDNSTIASISKHSMRAMKVAEDPKLPILLASSRLELDSSKKEPVPIGLAISLKKVLLDKIHGLFLQAISLIPKDDLCSRHHRGLLKAGHCCGPFHPVTNIILNTIWYDFTFPPQQEFPVDMIFTKSLARIEWRSLCGLVAFIRTLFPALSTYEAMRYLLMNNAEPGTAALKVIREGHATSVPVSRAYKVAAHAAQHPKPTALVKFAMEQTPVDGCSRLPSLCISRMLSSDDLKDICATFFGKYSPSKSTVQVQELTPQASQIVSDNRKLFERRQELICRRAEDSLHEYAQKVGHEYELHVICGVTAEIPEDGKFEYFHNMDGYPYYHINLWARRKGSQYLDTTPTLFFIECSKDKDKKDASFLCCPVSESSEDAGRCFHCECHGARIVHPPFEMYLGRSMDFEDVARGEHAWTNRELIEYAEQLVLDDDTLSFEDSIYFDPAWDTAFASFLNEKARSMKEEDEEDEDSNWAWGCKLNESLALEFGT